MGITCSDQSSKSSNQLSNQLNKQMSLGESFCILDGVVEEVPEEIQMNLNYELDHSYIEFDLKVTNGQFNVYKNHHDGKNQLIKKMKQNQNNGKKIFNKFDIVQSKKFEHPNILKFVESFQYKYQQQAVYEMVRGEPLTKQLLQFHKLEWYLITNIMLQMVIILKQFKQNKIMHTKLNPSIIFIDTVQDELTLVDQSCVKRSNVYEEYQDGSNAIYTAPELFDDKYGPECDVWTIGIISYIMFQGEAPFKLEKNAKDQVRNIREFIHSKINKSKLPKKIVKEAEDLIFKMLEKNPEKRITVDEILLHPLFENQLSFREEHKHFILQHNFKNVLDQDNMTQIAGVIGVKMNQFDKNIINQLFRIFDQNYENKIDLSQISDKINGYYDADSLLSKVSHYFSIIDYANKNDKIPKLDYSQFCILFFRLDKIQENSIDQVFSKLQQNKELGVIYFKDLLSAFNINDGDFKSKLIKDQEMMFHSSFIDIYYFLKAFQLNSNIDYFTKKWYKDLKMQFEYSEKDLESKFTAVKSAHETSMIMKMQASMNVNSAFEEDNMKIDQYRNAVQNFLKFSSTMGKDADQAKHMIVTHDDVVDYVRHKLNFKLGKSPEKGNGNEKDSKYRDDDNDSVNERIDESCDMTIIERDM